MIILTARYFTETPVLPNLNLLVSVKISFEPLYRRGVEAAAVTPCLCSYTIIQVGIYPYRHRYCSLTR